MTDNRKSRLDGLAVSLILICCVIWGLNQVIVKMTLPVVPPLMQGALRSALAAVLVGLWARHRGIGLLQPDGVNRAGVIAGALFALEFCCVYWGLQYTSASRAIVFLYLAPFIVALGMPFISASERLRPTQIAGLCLAFGALALAFRDGLDPRGGANAWVGDLLALGAGMAWGLTTVVIRGSGLSRMSPEKLLFYQMAVSVVCLPVLSLWLGEPWVWHWSAFGWFSMVLQTLVGAFASYLTWLWQLSHYPAMRISVFVFLTPVFALVFGAIWLREVISLHLVLAVALVAVGILLVNRRPAGA